MIHITHDITAEWLSERLRRVVVSVEPMEPFESQEANWLPLTIGFDDGSARRILYKQYKPDGIGWGLKEQGFYEHCAANMEKHVFAVCYDYGVEETEQTAWFLLQDLSETHRPHIEGRHEQEIRLAIPTLVELHARWWEDDILELDALKGTRGGACRMANACSPENIRLQASHWLQHELPRSREEIGATFTDEMTDLCTRAILEWPDLLMNRIGDGSQMTVVHGDAHLENMFYPREHSTHGVTLVDWETWERGIPAYDLAYMLKFYPEMEEEAMATYFDGLKAAGVTQYSWERFTLDYRLSVLCCLFPPVQWVRSWGGVWVLQKAIERFNRWKCDELLGVGN